MNKGKKILKINILSFLSQKGMAMFIGRKDELAQLKEFKKRKVAGIIVCCGRRRIGKSTLIEHFGERTRFLEFYGLAPREQLTNKDQLEHF